MKNTILVVIVLLVLAGAGIWFVRNQSATPAMEPTENMMTRAPSSAMPPSDDGSPGAMMESNVKEIMVEGSEFTFSPTELTLKKGEGVRLVFKNTGKMTHDWVVDELNVRTKIISGGTEEVLEFTPDKAGTFEYYCSVGQHRANGMVGTLTVTE